VDIFGWKRSLALGRAGIVLLLGLGFAKLVIGFGESDCCLTCFLEEPEAWFHGRVLLYVPILRSIVLMSMRSPARVFGLLGGPYCP